MLIWLIALLNYSCNIDSLIVLLCLVTWCWVPYVNGGHVVHSWGLRWRMNLEETYQQVHAAIRADLNPRNLRSFLRSSGSLTSKDIGCVIELCLYWQKDYRLPHYRFAVNLPIYAAACRTGFLLAHWALKMLEMDEEYQGNVEVTGEVFFVELIWKQKGFLSTSGC